MSAPPERVTALRDALERRLAEMDGAVVAFSGGVDSSLVAAVAARMLRSRALAVTAVSPALADGELDGARRVASAIGIRHEIVRTDELRRAGYRRNGADRCYHCKTELYTVLEDLAADRGMDTVLSGANADDRGDWRPGLRAAREHGVLHPLQELEMTKADVRAVAALLDVPSADKPASPCLASRIPYGSPVTPAALKRIDAAEAAIRRLGYREFRVRHHGSLGKVELAARELEEALRPDARRRLCAAVREAGYAHAAVDLEPFHSGALNRVLVPGAAASTRGRQ